MSHPRPASAGELLASASAQAGKAVRLEAAPYTAERAKLLQAAIVAAAADLALAATALVGKPIEPDPIPARPEIGAVIAGLEVIAEHLAERRAAFTEAWLAEGATNMPACRGEPERIRDDFGWPPEPTVAQLADQRCHRMHAGEPVA